MSAYQEIDANELNAMLSGSETILVDVRADEEVARGIIPGAQHISLALLPSTLKELGDGNVSLVFYCHSGTRSAQACNLIGKTERENVFNLRGGILAWVNSGLPLVPKN